MIDNSANVALPFLGKTPDPDVAVPVTDMWTVCTFNDHREVEHIWRKLETDGRCTVFQTYDWVSCWYEAVAPDEKVAPLVVLVVDGTGEPVWILPLCLYRSGRTRVISFADMGLADYTAPVMAATAPTDDKSIRAIYRSVFRSLPRCDLIHFEKLARTVDGVRNPLLRLPGLTRFPVSCHGIRLDGPWPQQAEKIMQRRLFSTIRRERKRLAKVGDIRVEKIESRSDMKSLMDRLIDMRDTRFATMGIPEMPPLWRNFYMSLLKREGPSLEPSIYTLSVSGEMIAACFGLVRGKHYYGILPSFEMGKWEKFRPGMQLFYYMLTEFAEKNGGEGYFDFTIGDEVYKGRFGCEKHPLYEWAMPCSLTGMIPFSEQCAKVMLRRYPKLYEYARKTASKVRPAGRRVS